MNHLFTTLVLAALACFQAASASERSDVNLESVTARPALMYAPSGNGLLCPVTISVTNRGQTTETTFNGKDALFENEDYAICLKKGSELTEQFNKALAELKADGTVKKIIDKYIKAS